MDIHIFVFFISFLWISINKIQNKPQELIYEGLDAAFWRGNVDPRGVGPLTVTGYTDLYGCMRTSLAMRDQSNKYVLIQLFGCIRP